MGSAITSVEIKFFPRSGDEFSVHAEAADVHLYESDIKKVFDQINVEKSMVPLLDRISGFDSIYWTYPTYDSSLNNKEYVLGKIESAGGYSEIEKIIFTYENMDPYDGYVEEYDEDDEEEDYGGYDAWELEFFPNEPDGELAIEEDAVLENNVQSEVPSIMSYDDNRFCISDDVESKPGMKVLLNFDDAGFSGKVLEIPDGVNYIVGFCFCGLSSVEEVIIPHSVKEMEKAAFFSLHNLKRIRIPEHLMDNLIDDPFKLCSLDADLDIY